jgi:hypothetical protein
VRVFILSAALGAAWLAGCAVQEGEQEAATDGSAGASSIVRGIAGTGEAGEVGLLVGSAGMTDTQGVAGASGSGESTAGSGGADGGKEPAGPCLEDVSCADECLFGFWPDEAGCPTCSCAPPRLMMHTRGVEHDTAYVTVQLYGPSYVAGDGELFFQFTWSYDDPTTEGEEEFVTLGLYLEDPTKETARWPEDGPFFEPRNPPSTPFPLE